MFGIGKLLMMGGMRAMKHYWCTMGQAGCLYQGGVPTALKELDWIGFNRKKRTLGDALNQQVVRSLRVKAVPYKQLAKYCKRIWMPVNYQCSLGGLRSALTVQAGAASLSVELGPVPGLAAVPNELASGPLAPAAAPLADANTSPPDLNRLVGTLRSLSGKQLDCVCSAVGLRRRGLTSIGPARDLDAAAIDQHADVAAVIPNRPRGAK